MARVESRSSFATTEVAAPPALVLCDVDGTLVLDNSFHVFLAAIWTRGSLRQRMALILDVAPRLLGRPCGGHAALKRRVLRRFGRAPAEWRLAVIDHTIARLAATRSAPVMHALATWKRMGAKIVLATAAPDFLARPLARNLGADCLATAGMVGPGWFELIGTRKAEAARALIAQFPDARVVVLTDHPDDLPLIALADEALVQAGHDRFARIAHELATLPQGPELGQIDPAAAQKGGGRWIWLDDRPRGPLDQWELHTLLSKHRHALLYVGDGHWQRVGPGQSIDSASLRRDCPLPPSSFQRLSTHIRRRVLRDWLGIFH